MIKNLWNKFKKNVWNDWGVLLVLVIIFLWSFFGVVWYVSTATVSWQANTEGDLGGYKIYYGTSSGDYDKVVDVDDVSSFRIRDLEHGKVYFFVVTAYDTSGNESGFSEEVYLRIGEHDDGVTDSSGHFLEIVISQNYPNPFSNFTIITIDATNANDSEVIFKIYNIKGERIKHLVFQMAGGSLKEERIDFSGMPSGMYVCHVLVDGRFVWSMKMIALK